MPLVKWSETFSVNVTQFDTHHKKLFEIVNDIAEKSKMQHSRNEIGSALKSLHDYTIYHFKAEEDAMMKYGFSGLAEQKKQHKLFIEKIEDYKKRFDEGTLVMSVEITSFLMNWLLNHIKKIDKEYGEFFNSKGMK